jgi:regulator of replication initiation timing
MSSFQLNTSFACVYTKVNTHNYELPPETVQIVKRLLATADNRKLSEFRIVFMLGKVQGNVAEYTISLEYDAVKEFMRLRDKMPVKSPGTEASKEDLKEYLENINPLADEGWNYVFRQQHLCEHETLLLNKSTPDIPNLTLDVFTKTPLFSSSQFVCTLNLPTKSARGSSCNFKIYRNQMVLFPTLGKDFCLYKSSDMNTPDLLLSPINCQPIHHQRDFVANPDVWKKINVVLKDIVEKSGYFPAILSANFGSWESQFEQRKYVKDCHAHIHFLLPLEAFRQLFKEWNVGNLIEPKNYRKQNVQELRKGYLDKFLSYRNAGHVKKLEEAVDDLKKDVGDLKKEVGDVKKEVGDVKKEVSDVKKEVGDVKKEVSNVKKEVSNVKKEVADMKLAFRKELNDVKVDIMREIREMRQEFQTFVSLQKK